jgi:hypothetical protein
MTVICMHCGSKGAMLFLAVCGRVDYTCLSCGSYSVSGMMQKIIKNGPANPRLARLVADNGRRYLRPTHQ